MRDRIIVILTISLLTFITACKKDSADNAKMIIGKWKLIEVYDGYANGGNFMWNTVENSNSHVLTFSQNGQYNKKENFNSQECIGTYVLLNSTNLEINTNCNTSTEKIAISELTNTTLIVDRQVIEGKIKYKYSSIK